MILTSKVDLRVLRASAGVTGICGCYRVKYPTFRGLGAFGLFRGGVEDWQELVNLALPLWASLGRFSVGGVSGRGRASCGPCGASESPCEGWHGVRGGEQPRPPVRVLLRGLDTSWYEVVTKW